MGTELRASSTHDALRQLLMYLRFLRLGMPMSSHFPFWCARLMLARVGAACSCMQWFDADNMPVPSKLINK
jgi:hypothetical protein